MIKQMRKWPHMKHITRCLNAKLVDIYQRAIKLEELNVKLRDYLPIELHEHCHAGCFNTGCLTLVTDDPVWASQLRYFLPQLRDKLRVEAGIYQLASIKITLVTEQTKVPTKPLEKHKLSENARETIARSGEACEYRPLKEALMQLARRNFML